MSNQLFNGFSKDTIQFFKELKANNDKVWFEANRNRFENNVMGPAKQFVLQMGPMLQQFRPDLYFEPKIDKSIFRLHRDVHFSKNKLPYKTRIAFIFWEGNRKKLENSGFYFHVEPEKVVIAAGVHQFPPPMLKAYREAVVSETLGPKLIDATSTLQQNGYNIGEPHYKKVPRGFDPDHPNSLLLRYNGMGTMESTDLPDEFYSEELVYFCFEKFKKMLPIHEWLVEFNNSF